MKVICIDDEYLILQRTVAILRRLPLVASAEAFLSGDEALAYLKEHAVDVVFLDINMPDMNGLDFARKIRERYDHTEIVFLTGHNEFALDAFKLHASGYLIKPIEESDLLSELQNIERLKNSRTSTDIEVVTFGNFDVLVKGRMVAFSRSRSKEILAYLISKKGTGVSRAELASVLWEDAVYDHGKQKQLDVYIRSLGSTLKEYGIEQILERNAGVLRVVPELFQCDFYQYLNGDAAARKCYVGEFLNSYSWAEYLKDVF